jgi:hypothetical protein
MSEWLTTGEMIDKLKPGEVAESKPTEWCGTPVDSFRVIKTQNGAICFDDSDDYMPLNEFNMRLQWRILPRYVVSFEEAKEAFKQGKTICCYIENQKITYSPDSVDINSPVDAPSWYEIFEGQWTILD